MAPEVDDQILKDLWSTPQSKFLEDGARHECGHATTLWRLAILRSLPAPFTYIRLDPPNMRGEVAFNREVEQHLNIDERAAVKLSGLFAEYEAYEWDEDRWVERLELDSGNPNAFSDCLAIEELAQENNRRFNDLAIVAFRFLQSISDMREIVTTSAEDLKIRLSMTYNEFDNLVARLNR